MQDILELKHKVMQEKLQKLSYTLDIYYSNQEKEEDNSLFLMLETIKRKYEQSFERIKNSKNINKSLKYQQLEEIVFEEIVKIEIALQREIEKKKKDICTGVKN